MLSKKYDVNFINPLLDAVLNVLSTMANIEVKAKQPYVNMKSTATEDITGQIKIQGYAKGVIALGISKGAILKIVNNMLLENYQEINDDISDAVGELTNIIAGQVRQGLSEIGMDFQASTPTVVIGKGKKIDHIPSAPILSIPFDSDDGSLVVEISLTKPD